MMNTLLTKSYIKEYSFPSQEDIFSCPFHAPAMPDGFDIICVARQSANAKHISLEEFWASALYNCLEDIFSDDDYEFIGRSTNIKELPDLPHSQTIKSVLTESDLCIKTVQRVFEVFRIADFIGYGGTDSQGYFAIVLVKSE